MKGSTGSFFHDLYTYNDVNHVVVIINDIILRILRTCFSLTGVSWLLIALLMATVCRKKKISKMLNNQNSPNFFTTLNAHFISFLLSQNMQTYKMCTILLINTCIITIIKHKKQPNVTSIYSIMSCS